MKRIINIIFKPLQTIPIIAEEEPLFGGILVFTSAVLIGSIGLIKNFLISWQVAIFHSLLLIFMWSGGMVLIDLLITGVLKLINPFTSGILNTERFKKLIIVQLYIAAILFFRPLLNIFISNDLSWILIFIWGAVLILAAVSKLWNVTEIKAGVSVAVAVVIVFGGAQNLTLSKKYPPSRDFQNLKNILDKNLPTEVDLLGFTGSSDLKDNPGSLIEGLDRFIKNYPDSNIISYCLLIKAKALQLSGETESSRKIYRQILNRKDIDQLVYDTTMMNLRQLLSDKEFVLLPLNKFNSKWMKILKLWHIPVNLSYYSDYITRINIIKKIIMDGDLNEFKSVINLVSDSFKNTEFEDDIYYWIGDRYQRDGDLVKALKYYEFSSQAEIKNTRKTKVESAVNYIEERIGGMTLLEERTQKPYALMKMARIYKETDKIVETVNIYSRVIKDYPEHSVAGRALMELAEFAEERGDFTMAIKLYNRLLNNFPISNLKTHARHKKNIIERNLNNRPLLTVYSLGWKKWQRGEYQQAIEIYKYLIEKFPESDMAYELQYSIAKYYRKSGKYNKAIREFRSGYNNFKDSPRGFDFGWQLWSILADDLRYYRRSVNWFEDIINEYPPGFKSKISGMSTIELAWKSAAICRKNLRDYKKAKQIYSYVIENYSESGTVARAIYQAAFIDDEFLHQYSAALKQYQKIISNYANTIWKEKAQKRIDNIYARGIDLLEKYY